MKPAVQRPDRGSLRIDTLATVDETASDAFVESHERGSIYHRAIWRKLIADLFGHKTHYLCAKRNGGKIVGVLPLVRLRNWLFGDFMVSMPYFNYGGAIGISSGVEQALMRHACDVAKELGCQHIEFRDSVALESEWPVRTDKVIMELVLPESADALWANFGSKLRAQIKRPQKEAVEVVHGGPELLAEFYRVFARNMRDLGTPVYPKSFFLTILATFPEAASLVGASVCMCLCLCL